MLQYAHPFGSGTTILIHSFAFYIENAITAITAKGGIPIISSVTPDNIWVNNSIPLGSGGRFVTYAQSIGTRKGIVYVDHFDYVAQVSISNTDSTKAIIIASTGIQQTWTDHCEYLLSH